MSRALIEGDTYQHDKCVSGNEYIRFLVSRTVRVCGKTMALLAKHCSMWYTICVLCSVFVMFGFLFVVVEFVKVFRYILRGWVWAWGGETSLGRWSGNFGYFIIIESTFREICWILKIYRKLKNRKNLKNDWIFLKKLLEFSKKNLLIFFLKKLFLL